MQIPARQPAAKQKGQAGAEENGRMCVSMRQDAEGGEKGRGGRWSVAASLKSQKQRKQIRAVRGRKEKERGKEKGNRKVKTQKHKPCAVVPQNRIERERRVKRGEKWKRS